LHFPVTTLGKLSTRLFQQAVQFGTGQMTLMLYSWEGKVTRE